MALTWGATTLNLIQDSYAPPVADANIPEIRILGDPSTPNVPASVIQQGGRSREHLTFDCWADSQTDIDALVTDKYNGQVREFTGHDGVSFDAVITQVLPLRRVFEHYIPYRITFLEATDI